MKRCFRHWPALAASLLALCSALALAQPAPTTPYEEARDALWIGDFETLEALHTRYNQPGQRNEAGRSKLVLFREGLDAGLDGPKAAREAYFQQMAALTLSWAQARPDSPFAHLLHARSLGAMASWYRGGGFSNTVSPEAWRAFERTNRQRADYLAQHAKVVARSSSLHADLLTLGRLQSWDDARMWGIFDAGMALNPDDEGLYRGMLVAALPKWGGDAARIDRVVQEVARRTRAMHGDVFYARMYAWTHDWQYEHRLFSETLVDWPRMRAGYRELQQRHPAPAHANTLAAFACLARDKETAAEMMAKIGTQPLIDQWGRNGRRKFDECKRWLAEP